MENRNEVTITFDAYSVNEGFARMVAAAFAAEFNPTLDEIEDIKTAVSEAVTNAIIHGYEETKGKVHMALLREEDELTVSVEDFGKDRGYREGKRAFFYDKTGAGAFGHGVRVHGSVYGQRSGGVCPGNRDEGHNEKIHKVRGSIGIYGAGGRADKKIPGRGQTGKR